MSMADDWKRLNELEHEMGTLQYGQSVTVRPTPGNPDLIAVSKDLIRFVGKKTDVNAWRVYLGPWQPQNQIAISPLIANAHYADPTPWAPPEPTSFDAMSSIPLYAQLQWGSGGIQHIAYVDWPKRGCLVQVSGNYVQVNAFANANVTGVGTRELPYVQATLAPEPGGGDATVPATYTYPISVGDIEVIEPFPVGFRNFQIPPFARAFVPLINWGQAIALGNVQFEICVMREPLSLAVGGPTNVIQSWRSVSGGVEEQSFTRDPFPIAGQEGGLVRIEYPFFTDISIGCMFFLDL
jgi:hypothetical protein